MIYLIYKRGYPEGETFTTVIQEIVGYLPGDTPEDTVKAVIAQYNKASLHGAWYDYESVNKEII